VSDFDVAALFAHPDDAELVAGGTLAREAQRGRRVALVDLTRGESGSRGTPETRAAEAAEAARILGADHRESLGLPDGGLSDTAEQRDAIVAAVRRLRPRVVILPDAEQRHPDHAAAGRLVYAASFLYGLSTMEGGERAPTLVVDVTSTWDLKLAAIAAFRSQFTPGSGESVSLPFDRFRENVELAGRRHGQRIGVRYGEGFVTREPVAVDDLLALENPSF
jgi:LmbE family N-acetylglucosaminyl deacetylase